MTRENLQCCNGGDVSVVETTHPPLRSLRVCHVYVESIQWCTVIEVKLKKGDIINI